jgi:hypothetical protein
MRWKDGSLTKNVKDEVLTYLKRLAAPNPPEFIYFLTHLHQTLNAPSHPIRNRLLRLPADSADLLAIIKQEGRV